MKTHRISIIMVIIALVAGIVFSASNYDFKIKAEASEIIVTESGAVKDLSLDEALKLAQENNLSLKQAALDRDKAVIEAEQAIEKYKNIDLYKINTFDSAKTIILSEKQKKDALNIAEKTYQVTCEKTKLQIQKYYYDVLQAQDLVKVNESSLERASKQLEFAKASFEVGTVAKTDVLTAEANLASVQAQLTTAKNSLDIAIININKEIGFDLATKLNLTTLVDYSPQVIGDVNIQEVVSQAMSTRLDVMKYESAKNIAEETYRLAVSYTSPSTYVSRLAKIDSDKATLTFANSKNQVIKDITQAYLNVKSAETSLDYLNIAVQQSEENMRLVSLRYEVGMATNLEVLDASAKLCDIEAKRIKAIYTLNLARISYETSKLATADLSASSGSDSVS